MATENPEAAIISADDNETTIATANPEGSNVPGDDNETSTLTENPEGATIPADDSQTSMATADPEGANIPAGDNETTIPAENPEGSIVPADDNETFDDADSALGDDAAMSTASLRSSIFDYEEEYGRTYHAFRRGKYVMPNDDPEQDRMDIHHHSVRLAFDNKHYFAPLERPTSILDVGAGTGIWAMDVADDHPNAQVVGIDLSPIQPTAVPPNLQFQIMDADEEWDFNERFDLVHTRHMNGFSIKSWPHFYQQAYSKMQPGGWVENQEFDLNFGCDDGTLPPDCAQVRWCTLWNEGVAKFGLTGRCYPDQMKAQMEAAGFVNVSVRFVRVPIGTWPRDKQLRQSGLYAVVGFIDGLQGLSLRVFTHGLGWRVEEMEVLLSQVREDFRDRRIHSYLPFYVVMGQKPPKAEEWYQ